MMNAQADSMRMGQQANAARVMGQNASLMGGI